MDNQIEPRAAAAFVAVVDSGTFSRAAATLGITQPSISARIASLERQLGTALFERGARRVRLTPAGEVFLAPARAILADCRHAVAEVRRFLAGDGGRLEVSSSSVPGVYLLPRAIATLRDELPGIEVGLSIDDSEISLERLRDRRVEVAVVGSRVRDRRFTTRRIATDTVVVVAEPRLLERCWGSATGRVRNAARVAELPFVLREPGSATREFASSKLASAGVDPSRLEIVLELSSSEAVREACLAGLGAAALSRSCVELDLASGRLVPLRIPGAAWERPLSVVTRARETLTPGAQGLIRILSRLEGAHGNALSPRVM